MARERKFTTEEVFETTKQLLLDYGYEGFTFSLLANHLKVSRGAIYKYFENKEELISEYIIYQMKVFLSQLERINTYTTFDEQFEYLMDIILNDYELHRIRRIAIDIPASDNAKEKENKKQLDNLHLDMYTTLQQFIKLGREEKRLNPRIPDSLILGFIFQTVDIPNHYNVPREDWIKSMKEIIMNGISNSN
ncbi:TetR/AcrR family transcriptional regulator [Oceanobacillus piezotolerans]|uniref:TetR/AcrR family transcriptional regulator n=1 Tax=Oceanobacillus piezotolerans TaxID=2448030 RepID=A0A498D7H1_9BACI|nr:TetR/AcrR family transcriptional regulator [Oceanobacillus piezotolerans]RLL42004.1 TetR/AcrR family transcriptional regulator [Oceanobacillus piezotolerans]